MAARLGNVDRIDDCWIWRGQVNRNGYGIVETGKVPHYPVQAHRAAWELVAGPIPDGLFILHTCDTPRCIRNDDVGFYELDGVFYPRRGHLFLGDNAVNMLDMRLKQRHFLVAHPDAIRKGEQATNVKMTEQGVRDIRIRAATRANTQTELAREYGVGITTINAIVHRRNWKHVV